MADSLQPKEEQRNWGGRVIALLLSRPWPGLMLV
jgi:hypothetical protein